MFAEILSILKFMTDEQTRKTIQSIAQFASREDKDWAKKIRRTSGKFSAADITRVSVFANSLLKELENTGLSEEKISKFRTVLSELVNNAFRHGCQNRQNCFVQIDCIYSPWFIEIQVRDGGDGFNLAKVLETPTTDRERRSGLQVVRALVDSLSTNQKGTSVTALIASADRITIETSIEKHGSKELCVVTLDENRDWFFLPPSWEPLQKTLSRAKQKYILVTWKRGIRGRLSSLSTPQLGAFIKVITGCHLDVGRYYAFVQQIDWVLEDLEKQQSKNVRFFDSNEEARAWLGQQMRHSRKD